ncbi:MAG TPA: FAD-dependent oxidoreductase, partial [Candidatus Limnocylindrales bacterium]|nr:FAD-dependent oxidoreductase [Candidatus Limnocylindrales bacterium]
MTSPDPSSAISYWLAASPAGGAYTPLSGDGVADVVVVGGGFTGLWTALALTDTDPSLQVTVLEATSIGYGASGRNGGFCQASLTHGLANGIRHFPDEVRFLDEQGLDNLRGLIEFVRSNDIDCDLEQTGDLSVADQPYQVDELKAWVDEAAAYGEELVFLDR